jgi:peptidoglycan/xylan/chitin deacetylase (PgdA/CDA1 family)
MISAGATEFARWLAKRRSTILCYHGVGPSSTRTDPGFLRVRPDRFRTQLRLLLDAGFEFVTVAQFAERADGKQPPPGLVALSFDDGMDDNHSAVLPILRQHDLPATVYVVTGLLGKPNPWLPRETGARMMTPAELHDLEAAGFEIGAHTLTHPDLSTLDFHSCFREIQESKRALEEMLDGPIRTFAYPFCRYGANAVAAVRAAGFEAAVTCEHYGSWECYELRRTLVTGKDNQATFLLKLADLHQPLWSSPPVRLLRATTREYREQRRARREDGVGPS